MDLKDAGQRIFRRHWLLILICLLLGLAAPVIVTKILGVNYSAAARVDLGRDAHGAPDSTSIGDLGLGLATSPQVLTTAMKQAHVHAALIDEVQNVQVTPVGTSGVLDVIVTDSNAKAAAVMAKSLATQIVQLRDQALYGASLADLVRLQVQSAALNQQIAAVVAEAKRFYLPQPGLQAQQADLTAQRTAVDQQEQQLAQTLAVASRPHLIDASATAGDPVDTYLPMLLPLGALLGLIVGISIAAAREAAAPTLNGEALGRLFGAPVLGRLPRSSKGGLTVDPWLANYVGAAASGNGVRTIQLIPVGRRPADVTRLADALDLELEGVRVVPVQLPAGRNGGGTPVPTSPDTGVVVVAPASVKSRFLAGLQRHLHVTGNPVIGVISYRGRLKAGNPEPESDIVGATDRSPVFEEAVPREPAGTASTSAAPASS